MVSASGAPSSNTLAGKRILVVGLSDDEWSERGNDHVKRAKALGVEVVLLGSEKAAAASSADTVISVDPMDYSACKLAVQRHLANATLDGIVTFLEERSEIAAQLQRDFRFPGHSALGTAACRDKRAMREILKRNGLPVPRFVHLNTRHEAEEAARWFPTPAFIKPAHGAGSIATRRVAKNDEIVPAFDDALEEIENRIPPELVESLLEDFSETRANLLLEEYLAPAKRLESRGLGRVGVELLVQDGKVVFFAMADGWCFSPSDHRYSTLCFPSRLEEDDERLFRSLADDIVSVFELSNGPVILDAVMTDSGPQLYEINARIDSSIVLPLVETCYGVDLVEQTLKIAVGMPLDLRSSEKPEASALLHMFLAPAPSRITRLEFPDALPFGNDCTTKLLKQEGEIVGGPEVIYDAIAILMLTGSDRDEVDSRFEHYVSKVKIELDEITSRRNVGPADQMNGP